MNATFKEMSLEEVTALADAGNTAAQTEAGYRLFNGDTQNAENDKKAVVYISAAADAGDAKAQSILAAAYYIGRGNPKDLKKAITLWRLAAEQDNTQAQFELGYAYFHGEGVAQNPEEGLKFLRQAAKKNQPQAQFELGYAYFHGMHVKQSEKTAIEFWRPAAEKGHPQSQFELGSALYATGGLKAIPEAAKWLLLSYKNEVPEALMPLFKICGDISNRRNFIAMEQVATEMGFGMRPDFTPEGAKPEDKTP